MEVHHIDELDKSQALAPQTSLVNRIIGFWCFMGLVGNKENCQMLLALSFRRQQITRPIRCLGIDGQADSIWFGALLLKCACLCVFPYTWIRGRRLLCDATGCVNTNRWVCGECAWEVRECIESRQYLTTHKVACSEVVGGMVTITWTGSAHSVSECVTICLVLQFGL